MSTEVIKQKRGRKAKTPSIVNTEPSLLENPLLEKVEQNIHVNEEQNIHINEEQNIHVNEEQNIHINEEQNIHVNEEQNITIDIEQNEDANVVVAKKRGRKPKGGKIVRQMISSGEIKEAKPNVILHLKCSLKELQSDSFMQSNIQSFNFSSNKNELYEIISSTEKNNVLNDVIYDDYENTDNDYVKNKEPDNDKESDQKEIWKKIKALEHNLHVNNISDKKSACFWCTCEFDNPPIFIPKHFIKGSYHVYGCFCSPECATAHLMDENIDSSVKFERYHLLNNIYTKIYDFKKNIKPAPNPFYMLDKYYGNLTIQEYRILLRNERLFLIVDKPLTRILPELHEDNEDFIINNKIIPSNTFKIKKKIQRKQQNKNNIIHENFGLVT